MLAKSGWIGKAPKKNNVLWANYDASNPVESSAIVGKNFPFDLRIKAANGVENTFYVY